jgi:hypothetical protein
VFATSAFVVAVGWLLSAGASAYWVAGLVFTLFVALVGVHDQVWRQLAHALLHRHVSQEGLARCHRDWQLLQRWSVEVPEHRRALSNDLDLFGDSSLFQLVCSAGTGGGRKTLRDWLLEPAEFGEVLHRQAAVRELAEHIETRDRLQLLGRKLDNSHSGPDRFIAWAESPLWLAARPGLRQASLIVPVGVFVALLATIFSLLSRDVGGLTIMVLLAVNAVLSVFFSGSVHELFVNVSTRNGEAAGYLTVFELLGETSFESEKLRQLQMRLLEDGGTAVAQLNGLRRIMRFANLSNSPMFFVLLYVPLQIVTLYDFHVLSWLENWQQRNGKHVRGWFNVLGEFEALSSLGTLAFENPNWCYPGLEVEAEMVSAENLGHPLLAADKRVDNDVEVGPIGTLLLVTGSNMSGKSTLLRALGTNLVLAQAGAPVCADKMSLPPVEIATSMRIHDSLADGVSFFMAELKRLKQIVDLAHQLAGRHERRLFYLLDEILQGTNSRERHLAVERVLSHLITRGAIGAISTHDLELANSGVLAAACHAVHFREVLHGDDAKHGMSFDYLLRPGVATTTNALKLLELVGLAE